MTFYLNESFTVNLGKFGDKLTTITPHIVSVDGGPFRRRPVRGRSLLSNHLPPWLKLRNLTKTNPSLGPGRPYSSISKSITIPFLGVTPKKMAGVVVPIESQIHPNLQSARSVMSWGSQTNSQLEALQTLTL